MEKRGIPLWTPTAGRSYGFIVTSVDRSVLEQFCLFLQGRMAKTDDVNKARAACALPPIAAADNNVVTWTITGSYHVVNPFDGKPDNDKARAFDIAIVKNNKATWAEKVSVDNDSIPDYQEAGAAGEAVGLEWGGRFSTPDLPHFQDTKG